MEPPDRFEELPVIKKRTFLRGENPVPFSYVKEKEEVERAVKGNNRVSIDFDDKIFERTTDLETLADALGLSFEGIETDWKIEDGKLVVRPI